MLAPRAWGLIAAIGSYLAAVVSPTVVAIGAAILATVGAIMLLRHLLKPLEENMFDKLASSLSKLFKVPGANVGAIEEDLKALFDLVGEMGPTHFVVALTYEKFREIVGQLLDRFADAWKTELDYRLQGFIDTLAGFFGKMFNALTGVEWGEALMEGIINGMLEYARISMTPLVEKIVELFNSAAGAHSAATSFIPSGVSLAQGLMAGFNNALSPGSLLVPQPAFAQGPVQQEQAPINIYIDSVTRDTDIDRLSRTIAKQIRSRGS